MPMSEEKTGKKDYERLRVAAENLYIENGMDGREISKTLGVSEITVSRWKKEGEWEDKKNFLKVTPAKLRTKMLEEAERVIKRAYESPGKCHARYCERQTDPGTTGTI